MFDISREARNLFQFSRTKLLLFGFFQKHHGEDLAKQEKENLAVAMSRRSSN